MPCHESHRVVLCGNVCYVNTRNVLPNYKASPHMFSKETTAAHQQREDRRDTLALR